MDSEDNTQLAFDTNMRDVTVRMMKMRMLPSEIAEVIILTRALTSMEGSKMEAEIVNLSHFAMVVQSREKVPGKLDLRRTISISNRGIQARIEKGGLQNVITDTSPLSIWNAPLRHPNLKVTGLLGRLCPEDLKLSGQLWFIVAGVFHSLPFLFGGMPVKDIENMPRSLLSEEMLESASCVYDVWTSFSGHEIADDFIRAAQIDGPDGQTIFHIESGRGPLNYRITHFVAILAEGGRITGTIGGDLSSDDAGLPEWEYYTDGTGRGVLSQLIERGMGRHESRGSLDGVLEAGFGL
uniref:Uncharacterized protein n=1 Tax=Pilchard orthomyxovirus TaxID=2732827 RepID=A0A6M4APY9_9ORTO|nr:putative protein S7A [Pilchard orthomyxovirus]